MQQADNGFTLIPTECPKFLAACATVGVHLQDGPGVQNVYTAGVKYDPDEPGAISYLLSNGQGVNPLAIAKVWMDPEQELTEADALFSRLNACKTPDEWAAITDDIENLHVTAAIGKMRLFSDGKFSIDSRTVSDQERRACEVLSGFAKAMRSDQRRNGSRYAALLVKHWEPSMFAWVKAWVFNYLELRDVWKAANPAIKIDRGDDFPLVIPKGKDFAKLIKRWA